MKVALIEIDTLNHHSLIFNWVQLSQINGWDLTVFTTKDIYDNVFLSIKDIPHQIILKPADESYFKFLKRIKKTLSTQSFNLVILLTLQSHILELLFFNPKNINIGITIHNAKTWFNGNVIRKPSHVIKNFFRKLWLRRASFYIVNSANMKNFIASNYVIKKEVLVMPFLLKRNTNKKIERKNKVIYPGMISSVRKRWQNVFQILNLYF